MKFCSKLPPVLAPPPILFCYLNAHHILLKFRDFKLCESLGSTLITACKCVQHYNFNKLIMVYPDYEGMPRIVCPKFIVGPLSCSRNI